VFGLGPGQVHRSHLSCWPEQRQSVWPTTEPPLQAGRISPQSTRLSILLGIAKATVAKRARTGRVMNCILRELLLLVELSLVV